MNKPTGISPTEQTLIEELLELHENRSPFLDDNWEQAATTLYTCAQRFAREQERIHGALPFIAAHVSELADPGDFLTQEVLGRPVLLVRGEDGAVRAFYNVCRHRGARLVGDDSGCAKRFSCPYHAWTWSNVGDLIAVPHEKTGFPGLNRGEFGLKSIACEEFAGWIWLSFAQDGEIDVAAHLGDMAEDLLAMNAADHVMLESSTRDLAANWKILVEGGLEAYHFRVAHRNTIAPLFLDNLSSYQCLGRHIRSVLPRATLPGLREEPESEWDLGKHANVLLTLFPGSQFLVQEDHFIWIQGTAVAADRTVLRLVTMVPKSEDTQEKRGYWQRNHNLTVMTLDEDFDLGESIQQGLSCGANTHLNFGRFEGALAKFNDFVEEAIA